MATPALSPQNYLATTLAQPVLASDTTIYLNLLPAGNEGYLELDEGTSSKEIIYYTSKGANFVTLPSVGAGRGVGGTTAVAHSNGAVVKMKLNAEWWKALQDGTAQGLGSIKFASLLATIFSGQVLTQANAGTAGGTIKYINLGGIKLLWALSAPGLGSGTSYTFTLPAGFFTTIEMSSACCRVPSGAATQYCNIAAESTSSIAAYLIASAGSGTSFISLFVIGT